MANVGFGGASQTQTYTANSPLYSDGVALPSGRAMHSGSTAVLITALYGYVSGRSAARSVRFVLGSAGTDWFTVGSSTSAQGQGYYGTNHWLVNGGTARFHIYMNGSVFFGRGAAASGHTYDTGPGWTGMLGGAYSYVQAPSAPRFLTATAHPTISGRVDLSWTAPADNGESGITGYSIFTSAGTLVANVGVVGTYAVTGLTPGSSYSYVVRASNAVTSAAGSHSVSSNTATSVAPGVPSAPRNLTATASTTTLGRIALSWDAPLDVAGGITKYHIYRDGAYLTFTTGTTFNSDALTAHQSYSYTVRALNNFAESTSTASPDSNSVSATAPGVPTAPRTLTAVANDTVAGRIDLAWAAPLAPGAGGVTGYTVYFSNGTVISTPTGTSYSVTGLSPGTSYTFYVKARNAIADYTGTLSAASNNANATATGEPEAPTGLTVVPNPMVAGRLTLSWTPPPGGVTGYNVYLGGVLVTATKATTHHFDDLIVGSLYTYTVRARNVVTDLAGSGGGPASAPASGSPTAVTSQVVPAVSVSNQTNELFNGSHVISAASANSITYAKTSATNVASSAVPGAPVVVNDTNTQLSGTVVVSTSGPTVLTYSVAGAPNHPTTSVVSGGTLTDNTNVVFNGTFIVTSVDAANKKFTYARVSSNVSARAATGLVVNQSNAVFNGENITITAITEDTISYAKTAANAALSTAAGSVTNLTNINVYNGTYTVVEVPSFNTASYEAADAGTTLAPADVPTPFGDLVPAASKATLDVRYRSGWAG